MTPEHELLSPDFYKRTRLPLLEADTMPTECYTSRDFYTLCLLYTSPSPRDGLLSRMPSSA